MVPLSPISSIGTAVDGGSPPWRDGVEAQGNSVRSNASAAGTPPCAELAQPFDVTRVLCSSLPALASLLVTPQPTPPPSAPRAGKTRSSAQKTPRNAAACFCADEPGAVETSSKTAPCRSPHRMARRPGNTAAGLGEGARQTIDAAPNRPFSLPRHDSPQIRAPSCRRRGSAANGDGFVLSKGACSASSGRRLRRADSGGIPFSSVSRARRRTQPRAPGLSVMLSPSTVCLILFSWRSAPPSVRLADFHHARDRARRTRGPCPDVTNGPVVSDALSCSSASSSPHTSSDRLVGCPSYHARLRFEATATLRATMAS
ncbi:hypothetical protein CDD83_9579 [Cordyceps sp. RAO-2017]|nr:hypothetical protein CDD83_9579 [Cordyceps sp. RAO-2017]